MTVRNALPPPAAFATFGELLRFLRRRARLTQRDLGLAVGYSEAHVCRLEQNRRVPDAATAAALFVPALGLSQHSELGARLVELAGLARETARQRPALASAGGSAAPVLPPAEVPTGVESVPTRPWGVVERTARLAEVHALLTTERGVVICGLPGMGKTSLAADVARRASADRGVGWITLTRGVNTSSDALVRRLAGFLYARGHTEMAPLLSRVEGADGRVPLDQQLDRIGAALAADPVLLCLDDAQLLADEEQSLAVLRHLVAATPAALLLTSREELPLPALAVLRLGGLEPDEARQLVDLLGGPAEPGLAERLVARTAGSPMLLRLAVGQLRGRSDPRRLVEQLQTEPQVTAYLLDTTLGGLRPPARRLLSLLAVFRQPVDLHDELLVELAQSADGPYDHGPALADLQHRQLVDQPAHATLHPLLADHIYTQLAADPRRRRRLHHVAAVWSERDGGDPLEAAHHYGAANEPEESVAVLTEHTEALVAQGHALAAAELAHRLAMKLRQRRPPADRRADPGLVRRLLLVRGDLLVNTVRAADAEAAYREALAAAGEPVARADAAWRLAQSLQQRGQAADALELCRRSAAALPPDRARLAGVLSAVESGILLALSRYDECMQAAERALALTEQPPEPPGQPSGQQAGGDPDDPADYDPEQARGVAEARARALSSLGLVHRMRRQLPAALRYLERATDAARQAGLHRLACRSRFNVGAVHFLSGDMTTALDVYQEVLAEMRAAGDSFGAARVLHASADIQLNRCELAVALDLLDQAGALKRAVGDEVGLANSENERAVALLASGRVAEARAVAEQVVAATAVGGEPWTRGYYLDTLGMTQLLGGDAPAAVGTFRAALAIPGMDRTDIVTLARGHLALALLSAGDVDAADELLDRESHPHAEPAAELEGYFLRGAVALARGETAELAAAAAVLARRVEETGWWRYRQAAAALAAAVDDPPPLTALPGLLLTIGE